MSLGLGQDPGAAFPWLSDRDSALQLGRRREEQPPRPPLPVVGKESRSPGLRHWGHLGAGPDGSQPPSASAPAEGTRDAGDGACPSHPRCAC